MHHNATARLTALVLCLCGILSMQAQTLEWRLNAYGFFDNSEGDDSYRTTMTYDGLRLSPEIGISLDHSRHALMAGYSWLAEWGHKGGFTDGDPIVYYRYADRGFRFMLGSFDRNHLIGDYPSFLIADTVRYYRPMIQGFAFQYSNPGGHAEVFLDWTRARSDTQREQFMLGFSARKNIRRFALGAEGYYYHHALTWHADPSQHIHDYFTAHPYVGYSTDDGRQSALSLRLGALIALDRERSDSWHTPVGLVAEADASYGKLSVSEMVYAGAAQQHYGTRNFGRFYWNDTYYQSHFYSRTRVEYRFIRHQNVEACIGGIFNVTGKGLNWHQTLTLKFNLEGSHDLR